MFFGAFCVALSSDGFCLWAPSLLGFVLFFVSFASQCFVGLGLPFRVVLWLLCRVAIVFGICIHKGIAVGEGRVLWDRIFLMQFSVVPIALKIALLWVGCAIRCVLWGVMLCSVCGLGAPRVCVGLLVLHISINVEPRGRLGPMKGACSCRANSGARVYRVSRWCPCRPS